MLLIQSILFFILGAAAACFFVLLFVPIIWRRALYLATKAVRMEIPLSLNEVEADHDMARAFHAVEICRMEEQVATAKTQAMEARLMLDTARAQICYLSPFEKDADRLQQKITHMAEEREKLLQENSRQKQQLEKVADLRQKKQQLQTKLNAQKSINKQSKRKISALKRQIAQLEKQQDALASAEQIRRKNEQMQPEELMSLRQEMQQVAAQIVADIAHKQGDQSPLSQMIYESTGEQNLAAVIHQTIKPPPAPPENNAP